jgi:hypothetical protein
VRRTGDYDGYVIKWLQQPEGEITMASGRGTCFVVMGFGKKTDFESGRTFDLDRSYRNLIKPAVHAAGFECVRADEIVHSGLIDVPMYEQLQAADIVIADLSTSNKNAFYELGVRHALRPYTTIVIAEDGMKAPFDVNHVVVRHYKHLGEDIGYEEVMRFRGVLTDAINTISTLAEKDRVDSPVFRFLVDLQPHAPDGSAIGTPASSPAAGATHSQLMKAVDDAFSSEDFIRAKVLLGTILELVRKEAPSEAVYITQRLALATYKSKHPSEEEALKQGSAILVGLEPETSNDTETLGLWGAIHKRLWKLTGDVSHLDEAVRALARGFYIRNDYYNGINFAFLLNVRAAHARDPMDVITDCTLARRVRREVLTICDRWLAQNQLDPAASSKAVEQYERARYWVLATRGEAKLGLGDPAGQKELDGLYATAPQTWMANTTREQVSELVPLLADSPSKYLKLFD